MTDDALLALIRHEIGLRCNGDTSLNPLTPPRVPKVPATRHQTAHAAQFPISYTPATCHGLCALSYRRIPLSHASASGAGPRVRKNPGGVSLWRLGPIFLKIRHSNHRRRMTQCHLCHPAGRLLPPAQAGRNCGSMKSPRSSQVRVTAIPTLTVSGSQSTMLDIIVTPSSSSTSAST